MTAVWTWVVVASVAAWATKAMGLAVPAAWLADPRVQRVTATVPVAVLAGLVAVALVDGGGTWRFDPALLAGATLGAGVVVTGRGGVLGALVTGCVVTAGVRLLMA